MDDDIDGLNKQIKDNDALFKKLIDYVRSDPDRLKEAGKALDRDYSTQAIRPRMELGMLCEQSNHRKAKKYKKKRVAHAFGDKPFDILFEVRFMWALSDVIHDDTELYDLPKTERRKLAERRVLICWLFIDPVRDEFALKDGGLMSEFQQLRGRIEYTFPDFYEGDAEDENDLAAAWRLRESDPEAYIPKVREAYDYLLQLPMAVDNVSGTDAISSNEGETLGKADAADEITQCNKGEWLTLAQAERLSGINRGTIHLAASKPDSMIEDNGKKGRTRRLKGSSFNKWFLERAQSKASLNVEPDAAVKRKMQDAGL